MEKIVITQRMVGICLMQVCCEKSATDDEILAVCNKGNPSGTSNGWVQVCRTSDPDSIFGDTAPVQCADDPERLHVLVAC